MRFFRLKRPRATAHRSNLYPVYAVVAVITALALALGVVSVLLVRRAQSLETGYDALTGHIQADLNLALRKFGEASLPKADLAGEIVPTMRMYLYSADSFNEVLTDQYGESVLDEDLYQQITLALDDIERRVNAGQSTDSVLSQLGQYMATLETNLASKFSYNNLLLPQTAKR